MLFVTGLLTLLAVTYAGGDHIKGHLHMQEQVAQEDIASIPVIPYGTKTAPSTIKQMGAASKTASAPALHHTVKTMADKSGKTQLQPAVHHTAKLPVTQDQVAIDDPLAPLSGIKTTKTVSAVKTKFTQADTQIRDPVARPVVQTVKTIKDPVLETRDVKTVKTAETVKTRFSQQDAQVRNPIAQPVTKTVQVISDPATDSIKTVKTVTKTQIRDPIARPVIQTIKTTDDLPHNLNQKTVKTGIKTSEPSTLHSKMTLKTSQKTESSSTSRVPESIVSAARRNTMRTVLPPEAMLPGIQSTPLVSEERRNLHLLYNPGSQLQAGLEMINDKGEIMLDDETLKLLQNSGGIIKENGEISLNEEAMRILQNLRGSNVSPVTTRVSSENIANIASEGQAPGHSAQILPTDDIFSSDKVAVEPILRTMNLGETRRLSNPNQRQQGNSRVALSRSRSQINTLQNTVSRSNLGGNTGRIEGVTGNDQALRSTGVSGIQRGSVSPTRQGIAPLVDLKSSNDPSLLLSGSFGQRGPATGSQRGSVAQGMRIQGTGRLDFESGIRNQGSITTATGSSRRSGTMTTGSRSVVMENALSSAENKPGVRSSAVGSQRRTTLQRSSITAAQTSRIRRPVQDYGFTYPSSRRSLQNNLQPRTQIGSISDASLRSQDKLREQITTMNDGKILFNGEEISLDGLQPGQLFDENLKPILPGISDSNQAEGFISSDLNQNIKPDTIRDFQRISGSPRVQTGAISTQSRQQSANIMKEEMKLRTSGRASGVNVDQPNLRSNARNPSISPGLRQSTPAVSQPKETILFNGKEISIGGLRAGQQFDENLQPILTSKPIEINPLVTSQNVRPASAPGIMQSAGVPAVIPNYSSGKPLSSGNARRRQQAINTPDNKLKLRIPNRVANMPSSQINTKPITSIDALRSANIMQTGGMENINRVLFNGKEISVSGLRSGQIFDENLQPVMPENTRIVSPVNVRTSTGRQYIKPAAGARVSNSASQEIMRRPPVVPTPVNLRNTVDLRNIQPSVSDSNKLNMPPAGIMPIPGISLNQDTGAFNTEIRQNEKILGLTSSGQQISGIYGGRNTITSNVDSLRLSGRRIPVIPREKLSDPKKLTSVGSSDKITFNGQEINISGLKPGQMFDENLQPISSGIIDAPKTRNNIATLEIPQTPSLEAELLKSSRERSQLTSSIALGISQGSRSIPSPQRSRIPSAGVSSRTGSASLQRASSMGLRKSGMSQSVQTGLTGARISSTASQQRVRQQNGILSSGAMPSFIPQLSGISAAAPGALRSNALLSQPSPGLNRGQNVRPQSLPGSSLRSQGAALPGSTGFSAFGTRTGQIIPENILPNKEIQLSPELRASIPGQSQSMRGGSMGAYNIRRPQQPVLRAPAQNPVILSAQRSPAVSNAALPGNADTVLFNGKEIHIGEIREGQMFDSNLQPVPSLNLDNSKVDGNRLAIPQPLKPASRLGSSQRAAARRTSSTYGSGMLTSRGVIQRQRQASTTAGGELRMRVPVPAISAQRTPVVSNAALSGNADTVLFNGKEISIGEIREGQMFDANLQPVPSLNLDNSKVDGSRLAIPQPLKPASGLGSSQRAAARRTSATYGSGILTSRGVIQRQRQASTTSGGELRMGGPVPVISAQRSPVVSNPALSGNADTVLFNGKEIRIGEIREGQMFDSNLQPVPSLNLDNSKVDGSPLAIPQPLKPASGLGSSQRAAARRTSSAYGSDITSRGVIQRQRQVSITAGGELRTRVPASAISAQRTPAVRNAALPGNANTVLLNGKEISIGEIREGQMFDANLQPIPSLNLDNSKVDGSRLAIPQPLKPASGLGSSQRAAARRTSSTYGSGILTSRGDIQRQRQASTSAGGELRTRVPTSAISAQRTPAVRNAALPGNANTVLLNGKEISIGEIREGQMFDANLQPIPSLNLDNSKVDGSRLAIPQPLKPASGLGTSQRVAARRTSSTYGSGILTSRGDIQRQRQASTAAGGELRMGVPVSPITVPGQPGMSSGVTSNRQDGTVSNEDTILFNGKEININGLKPGQIFDENLKPILSSNVGTVLSDVRSQGISLERSRAQTSVVSGLRPESPRQRASAVTSSRSGSLGLRSPAVPRQNSQAPGSTLTIPSPAGSPVGSGSQRNRMTGGIQRISSDQGILLTSTATAGSGAPLASSLLSSSDIRTAGNSGSISGRTRDISSNIPIYSSGLGGSNLQRKISQDRISQEVSQVNIENPVIEQKQAGTVLTKVIDPVSSTQTQLPVDDILEQKSLSKAHPFISQQVQETIPFTSQISPKVTSKTTLTKLSQVSQKDIDTPIFQQRVAAGDFKGYLPLTSFLPPFNYGLPKASQYRVKTPIVQEQQRLEQIFV